MDEHSRKGTTTRSRERALSTKARRSPSGIGLCARMLRGGRVRVLLKDVPDRRLEELVQRKVFHRQPVLR